MMRSAPEKSEAPLPPKTADQLEEERVAAERSERMALEGQFSQYGHIVMPSDAQPPILSIPIRRALSEWMAEMNARKELAKVKLEPRRRVLLDGPPGCGKTTLGHHVAARMGLPMVTVTASAIIGSYVGESARNIAGLFRAARRSPNGVVLFFDELDAIARKRGKGSGGAADAERDGSVIALLAEMDRHDGMLFAATNVPDGIDPAVQRRFQIRMDIGLPGEDERRAIIRLYMQPFALEDGLVNALAGAFDNGSPALIKDMCEALKRGLILGDRLQLDTAAGAIVRRSMTSIKPHEDSAIPALWGGAAGWIERIDDAAAGCWPPALF